MKHSLKIFVIMLCVLTLNIGFALPVSRADKGDTESAIKNSDMGQSLYRPSLRQGGVLFVEDCAGTFGPATHPDPVWDGLLTTFLGAGNYGWFMTDADSSDGPPFDTMISYELVIWNTYDYWWDSYAALTTTDQTEIGTYMDNGGMVWLIGQDALYSGVPYGWMSVYFHMQNAIEDYWPYCSLGVNVNGLNELSGYSCFNISDFASNPFFQDELTPDAYAHGVLEDADSGKVVGIFYPGQGDWVSAFWALDLRTCTPPDQQESMVHDMLDAFGVLGIQELPGQETARMLHLNIAPEPVVRSATISYITPIAGNVKMQIYNKTGQLVKTLVDEYKPSGSYSVTWTGQDARNVSVPNGVYFVRLTCGKLASAQNLVLMR
jgi:hypothetical protein